MMDDEDGGLVPPRSFVVILIPVELSYCGRESSYAVKKSYAARWNRPPGLLARATFFVDQKECLCRIYRACDLSVV